MNPLDDISQSLDHQLIATHQATEAIKGLETPLEAIVMHTQPKEVQKIELVGAQITAIKGDKGDQGEKGDKGDTGDRGEKGDTGADSTVPGIQGEQGLPGKDGKNGKDGKDGLDGKDGADGKDGKKGKDGKDGSPDSGSDIKTKLESLPKGERLNYDNLDGLPNLASFRQSSKTVSLVELDDVDYSGLTRTNGKYVLGSGGGAVTSVNSLTGAVVLTTSDIAEGTNLYYTNARARASISLTTTGSSGAATYDSGTGVLNIPQYSGGSGGISRTVASISAPATAGATASTDYVYFVSGTTTITLPTAVGNSNRYSIKNSGSNTVTIATTSAQTIDGSASATMIANVSLDLVSDGANWQIL